MYIDDIIIFSKGTVKEHVDKLTLVFDRLRNAGLKLKPSKCRLLQRKVAFLGCVVSEQGIEPQPEKVSAIVDWAMPKTVGDVCSFVGLCSYYRNFIKDLSVIAAPLFDLTRKDVRFKWDDTCRRAFDLLKE